MMKKDNDLDIFDYMLLEDMTENSEICSTQEINKINESINSLRSSEIEDDTTTMKEKYKNNTNVSMPAKPKKRTPTLLTSLIKTKTYEHSIDIDVEVLLGTVSSVDVAEEEFGASLISVEDDKLSNATFSFEDIQYESDKILINEGARFIWTIGKERKILEVNGKLKYGEMVNISRILFRRTKRLNKKAIEEVEKDAEAWANFFGGLD